jgi:hypothetical protein
MTPSIQGLCKGYDRVREPTAFPLKKPTWLRAGAGNDPFVLMSWTGIRFRPCEAAPGAAAQLAAAEGEAGSCDPSVCNSATDYWQWQQVQGHWQVHH